MLPARAMANRFESTGVARAQSFQVIKKRFPREILLF
jgi:hypothetical protein